LKQFKFQDLDEVPGTGDLKMSRGQKAGTILTLVLGAAAGAVVALLLTSETGEELRGDVAAGVSDGVKQVRAKGKDLKHRAQKQLERAKDHLEDAIKAGDGAYNQAKKA
jgi:gas vesicle protein